jgi:hypothetical protein
MSGLNRHTSLRVPGTVTVAAAPLMGNAAAIWAWERPFSSGARIGSRGSLGSATVADYLSE